VQIDRRAGPIVLQRAEHLLERLRLLGIAWKDLAGLGETAGIEHQSQGHHWTIGALFLGVTKL